MRMHWERFVEDNFNATETNRILGSVDWETWLFTPGLAPVPLDFSTKESNESAALADEYIALGGESSPADFQKFNDYYSNLKVVFLNRLIDRIADLDLAIVEKIDTDLELTETLDPEVKNRWFPLGIRMNYLVVVQPAHDFVSSVGRVKYLTPTYTALKETGQTALAK